jgi:hypothetical protein
MTQGRLHLTQIYLPFQLWQLDGTTIHHRQDIVAGQQMIVAHHPQAQSNIDLRKIKRRDQGEAVDDLFPNLRV